MKSPDFPDHFNPQHRFRLRFKRQLADFQLRHGSTAEGFGVMWEKTLDELPVDDDAQGQLYRELINWAMSDKLFTNRGDARLACMTRGGSPFMGSESWA